MPPASDKGGIVYFIRTDSLGREARVARLFHALTDRGQDVEVFGIVKSLDGFAFRCKEYVCRSDAVSWKFLKIPLKLIEIQVIGLRVFWKHYRKRKLIIIANHEFLLLGLLLRTLFGARIVIDLHEHYFASFFRWKSFSCLFFLRVFSGVIFANRQRAADFLGNRSDSGRVAILRNFPDIKPGSAVTPSFCDNPVFRIGIVGGDRPGRYTRESIEALDVPEFASRVEIHTFGTPINMGAKYFQIVEHGTYRHEEIVGHLGAIDSSLVFYDPTDSENNRLCEPNRFFEAFNAGKVIFCFYHSSLDEFSDHYCVRIDQQNFDTEIRANVLAAMLNKDRALVAGAASNYIKRRILTYEDGIHNLEFLIDK